MSRNKRSRQRFPILATALIKVNSDRDAASFESMIANISHSGLGVYSYIPIEENTPVSIKITFHSIQELEHKDALEGRIVHSAKLGKIYYLGIKFNEELSRDQHPFLYNYLGEIVSWD